MPGDRDEFLAILRDIVSAPSDTHARLSKAANLLRNGGKYRWVGLYDVDRESGQVSILVWSGSSAPEHPAFPIHKGLTGVAVATGRTVNVGDVAADPHYLTAFGTTRSEIIVPVFDPQRESVIGTIDVESELRNAFGAEAQSLLEECAELIRPLWERRTPLNSL